MKTTLSLPSNRSFGWTFTGVFALAALFHPWAMAAAVVMAIVTMTRAHWLTALNRAWMRLGELMGRIVNPIVLGVIYFAVFTPVGLFMRLIGRDSLARRWDRALPSYWVRRDPPGPAEDSFNNLY